MYPFQKDSEGLEDIDFYAVQLNSNLSFLDNSVFIFQWLRVDNIRMTGDDVLRDAVDDYNMYLQLSGQGHLVVTDLIFPQELGYADKFTLQLDNDRVFDSPIDFFASVAWSKSHPNGEQVHANNMPPNIQEAIESLYLLSSDNQDSQSGWAFYTGVRYNIGSALLRNPKIGLEYFQGSEYWMGLNVAASDPYQKLNTRGSVWEIYWVQPCVENMLQFRTGYQLIDREYTESLFAGLYGAPEKTDEEDTLIYASFEFMF
jgi:hypothetical protein